MNDAVSGTSAVGMQLPVLQRSFSPQPAFLPPRSQAYQLLPLQFIALDADRYVVTNFVGEFSVLSHANLRRLIHHQLLPEEALYHELRAKHFLLDDESTVALDLLAVKYRTKKAWLGQLTSLFMFVVTLRCDHSCPYCQVSRRSMNRSAFDMSVEDADKAVALMFQSPSPTIKVEFQGGEPLLNPDLIRRIVMRVEEENLHHRKDVQFVIATNLAFLNDEMLEFAKDHDICFSTSLDGPRELHNRNRPRHDLDSYEMTLKGIGRIRECLGNDRVSALMTTTLASLDHPTEIVDEYVRLAFDSIFLRTISPYGFAIRSGEADLYGTSRWLDFYKTALSHIVRLCSSGVFIREELASTLLRKILTPFEPAYVDMLSPANLGIGCLLFNYDGDIYASDEARMLAEMGDRRFRLGSLKSCNYNDVLLSKPLVDAIDRTMTDSVPMCSDCGFRPYCGSDPVFHHATQGDMVGFKPTSSFCQKSMGVLRHLFTMLVDDPKSSQVLSSWI